MVKDEELAQQAYGKAESSDNVTKAKVEKARKVWEGKARIREDGQKKLQVVLDQVNSKRTQFYHIDMPEIIDKVQAMDENRSEKVVAEFSRFAECFGELGSSVTNACNDISTSAAAHNKSEDSKVFSQLHKQAQGLPAELTVYEEAAPAPAAPAESAVVVPQTLGSEMQEGDDDELPEVSPAMQYQQIRILYDYSPTDEGGLHATANEYLGIVSNDGSGWVLAMKQDGTQGYVPASYLEGMG